MPLLFCDGYLRLYVVETLFSNPVTFKNIWVAWVTDYAVKRWYLHNDPAGSQITTGYKFFFRLYHSYKPYMYFVMSFASPGESGPCIANIFTLTTNFLVCIFLKTVGCFLY